ncbi:hypothetical protein D3C85_671730 [compost metagenome]
MKRAQRTLDELALGLGDRPAGIVDAVSRQGPAVVLAAPDDIDFVTATGAVLVGPELARPGIEGGALLIAMTVGPDFRAYIGLADEGVVIGHLAIRVDAHHLALQFVQVLGGGALVVLAQGDEQVAVAIEHQARAEVIAYR